VIASATTGLAPAIAAARPRLALVGLLFGLAALGWWWTLDQMRGMSGTSAHRLGS
jgi:hypothetical protein